MPKKKTKKTKKLALKENLYDKVKEEFEKNRKIHVDDISKKFKCSKTQAIRALQQLMLEGVMDFGDLLNATYIKDWHLQHKGYYQT